MQFAEFKCVNWAQVTWCKSLPIILVYQINHCFMCRNIKQYHPVFLKPLSTSLNKKTKPVQMPCLPLVCTCCTQRNTQLCLHAFQSGFITIEILEILFFVLSILIANHHTSWSTEIVCMPLPACLPVFVSACENLHFCFLVPLIPRFD